ncbi:hypothetical protein RM590_28170 [Streptomyces sp. DSM 44938]|uniref:Uncharacterized protein n=1 Tax=Streptomyces litchfieldiae TaxID=3075543 RepID=A0ABU2MXQ0_9ACTN|nr:hypothetical protein [Streptomyces sp. DSM 44938]MDT0346430.1 hypothetical protein [Streptomyces sp. DSM 44938]
MEAAATAGHLLCLLTQNRAVCRHERAQLPPDALDIDTLDTAACAATLAQLPDLAGLINSTGTFSVPAADLAANSAYQDRSRRPSA